MKKNIKKTITVLETTNIEHTFKLCRSPDAKDYAYECSVVEDIDDTRFRFYLHEGCWYGEYNRETQMVTVEQTGYESIGYIFDEHIREVPPIDEIPF